MRVRRIFPLVVACCLLAIAAPAEALDEPSAGCADKARCRSLPPCDSDALEKYGVVCYVLSCVGLCP